MGKLKILLFNLVKFGEFDSIFEKYFFKKSNYTKYYFYYSYSQKKHIFVK